MKKYLLLLLICLMSCTCVFAINWEERTSTFGNRVYLDLDSITEFEDYYFYNIKFKYENKDNYIILTIQSQKNHPFSARIKSYSESEYDALNGDYENITANKTENMEPVTYNSIVYACYKRVKQIKASRHDIKIIN